MIIYSRTTQSKAIQVQFNKFSGYILSHATEKHLIKANNHFYEYY